MPRETRTAIRQQHAEAQAYNQSRSRKHSTTAPMYTRLTAPVSKNVEVSISTGCGYAVQTSQLRPISAKVGSEHDARRQRVPSRMLLARGRPSDLNPFFAYYRFGPKEE